MSQFIDYCLHLFLILILVHLITLGNLLSQFSLDEKVKLLCDT